MDKIDLKKIREGNRRALAKAITMVESTSESDMIEAQHILEQILPHTGNSIRIGITGTPGVGKSTLIEALGLYLVQHGHRVAVLAVDPSSPRAGGSILGDKTRMKQLSIHENAFIRPSPTAGNPGGVAEKTRETILICESAGYDVIMVETVGVGQSEYQVAEMVDFFLLLIQPNSGDELQGIKKGIIELADGLVVNKADGEGIEMAEQTCQYYRNAIQLFSGESGNKPEVLTCSALEKSNIDSVWQMIDEYRQSGISTDIFTKKRSIQNSQWLHRLMQDMLIARVTSNPDYRKRYNQLQQEVVDGLITPMAAAREIMSLF